MYLTKRNILIFVSLWRKKFNSFLFFYSLKIHSLKWMKEKSAERIWTKFKQTLNEFKSLKSIKRGVDFDMILNDDLIAACPYLNFLYKNFEFIKDSTHQQIRLDRTKEYLRFYNRDFRKQLHKSPIVNDSI